MTIRKKSGFNKIGFICIFIVFLFNSIGIGYANWESEIKMNAVISTGYINPVFSDFEIIRIGEFLKIKGVEISHDKKTINLKIDGVKKGDLIKVKYKVENQGTIPIYCKVNSKVTTPVAIFIEESSEEIIGCYGKNTEGIIKVLVNDVEPGKTYNFSVGLSFRQYNMLN